MITRVKEINTWVDRPTILGCLNQSNVNYLLYDLLLLGWSSLTLLMLK